MNRFYLPPDRWTGGHLLLDGEEGRHCSGVLRHRAGDTVVVFDGEGRGVEAVITAVERNRVHLTIVRDVPGPEGSGVHLAYAVPKGKVAETILQKGTELGVESFHPLVTGRTIVRPEAGSGMEKGRKTLVEAAKQCGRNRLPELHPAANLAQFLKALPAAGAVAFGCLESDARPFHEWWPSLCSARGRPPVTAFVVIGPEGDFTAEETGMLCDAGAIPWGFGPVVMRCDTAALFAVSVLAQALAAGRVS
jgi:16S rRNA (uracil1498-N3)-methyltransferase